MCSHRGRSRSSESSGTLIECGEGPVRQIGKRVGLPSTSSVAYQLGRLEALGLISRSRRRWRSCRLGT
ncbi:LexA family transcriptional regulator [Streptomyces sp900116325]|uniref:LexA family protein n=1 Tax=Streptomyces sp. 900116325 TaxID=3154295 RepID=UPI0033AC49A9